MIVMNVARQALQEKLKKQPATLICIHNPSPTIRQIIKQAK